MKVAVTVFLVFAAAVWLLGKAGVVDLEPAAFCPNTYLSAETQHESWLDGETEPMASPGPRPLLIFDVNQPRNGAEEFLGDAGDTMIDETGLLDDLEPGWKAQDKVQIVVCQYRHNVDARARETCEGHSLGNTNSVPVLSADYRFKVYEATTKKLLGTFELPGAVNDRTCPWMVGSRESGLPLLIAKPGEKQIAGKLRSFVEPSG